MQYFLDEECTIYAGNTDLEPQSDNCSVSTNSHFVENPDDMPVFANLLCTTDAIPRVPVDSAVAEYVAALYTLLRYSYVTYSHIRGIFSLSLLLWSEHPSVFFI